MTEISVSASSLMDFLVCRQRAKFRLEHWALKAPQMQREYGTLIHDCLAYGYKWCHRSRARKINPTRLQQDLYGAVTQPWVNSQMGDIDKLNEMGEVACVLVSGYFLYWYLGQPPKGGVPEVKFKVKLWGVPVRGRLDLLRDHIIYEYKTMSRINPYNLLLQAELSLQNRMYVLAVGPSKLGPVKGLILSILRKPQLKRGKKESISTFVDRVAEDIAGRPTWYFQRIPMSTAREPQKIRWSLRQAIKEYISWRRGNLPTYQNTCSCVGEFVCDYAEVCAGDQKIETDPRFYQKERGHK